MKRFVVAPLLAWSMVLALPAWSAVTVPAKPVSPTMAELGQWKKDVLGKFDQITYLDADGQPLSEAQFFQHIEGGKRAFDMNTNSATPKQLELRLHHAGQSAPPVSAR